MKIQITTAALLLCALLCSVTASIAQIVMEPSDRPVSLTGAVREVHGYGPPGYGEDKKTDIRVTYLIIELPVPINIPCTPERPEWKSIDCAATKKLRLFFPGDSERQLEWTAKKMAGKQAFVTGRLSRQTTAGEYTPIILNVTAIERPVPK